MECPMCGGHGSRAGRACLHCSATGAVPEVDTLVLSDTGSRRMQELMDQIIGEESEADFPPGDWSELSELELFQLVKAVSNRSSRAMMMIRGDQIDRDLVDRLRQTAEHSRRLGELATADHVVVTPTRVKGDHAEVLLHLATCLEHFDDVDGARQAVRQARDLYVEIDDHANAQRCDHRLDSIAISGMDDGDERIATLRSRVDQARDEMASIEALTDLGEALYRLGNYFEALQMMRRAESELAAVADPPSGAELATSMVAALGDGGETDGPAGLIRLQGLYRRVWEGLGAMLDGDEATEYRLRVARLDGRIGDGNRDNADFSNVLLDWNERERQRWTWTSVVRPEPDQSVSRSSRVEALRASATATRTSARAERRKELDRTAKARKQAEGLARRARENQPTGILSKLTRGAMCTLGVHKGDWYPTQVDGCHQVRPCLRCGRELERIEHGWSTPVRVTDDQCEFLRFCDRCGEESESVDHSWSWTFTGAGCEQHKVCRVCASIGPKTRMSHDWSGWTSEGPVERRRCRRCGKVAVRDAPSTGRTV